MRHDIIISGPLTFYMDDVSRIQKGISGSTFRIGYTSEYQSLYGIDEYSFIESVIINQCPRLQSICHITYLRQLKKIAITNCKRVEDLCTTLAQQYIYLQDLDLSGCNLTHVDFLTKNMQLRVLTLGNNKIVDLSPINQLHKLEYLSLSQNCLTDEVVGGFKNQSVRSLDLSFNRISSLKFLHQCQQLEQLFVQYNDIRETKEVHNFGCLDRIAMLQCDNNAFNDNYDYYTEICKYLPRSIKVNIIGVRSDKNDYKQGVCAAGE